MNKAYIPYYEKEMEIKKEPVSIFDQRIAGQGDTNGNYYLIIQRKGGDMYAMTPEDYYDFLDNKGRKLEEEETLCVNGERSRFMTYREEREWDEGAYDGMHIVDLWGNIQA